MRTLPKITVAGDDFWPIYEADGPTDGGRLLLQIPAELTGKVKLLRRGPLGEPLPVHPKV